MPLVLSTTSTELNNDSSGIVADLATTVARSPDIEAVIFDMFDTLLWMHKKRPWLKFFCAVEGCKFGTFDIPKAQLFVLTQDGRPSEIAAKAVLEQLPRVKIGTLQQLMREQNFEAEVKAESADVQLYPETKEALDKLRDMGLKLGLVSNLAAPYAVALQTLGIHAYFDVIVFSFAEGVAKGQADDHRIYERAAERLNVDLEKCLFVGDTIQADYESPIAAGMQAVHLDRRLKKPVNNSAPPRRTIAKLTDLVLQLGPTA